MPWTISRTPAAPENVTPRAMSVYVTSSAMNSRMASASCAFHASAYRGSQSSGATSAARSCAMAVASARSHACWVGGKASPDGGGAPGPKDRAERRECSARPLRCREGRRPQQCPGPAPVQRPSPGDQQRAEQEEAEVPAERSPEVVADVV